MRFTNRRCLRCHGNILREDTKYGYMEWCLMCAREPHYNKNGEIVQPLTAAVTSMGGEHNGFKGGI